MHAVVTVRPLSESRGDKGRTDPACPSDGRSTSEGRLIFKVLWAMRRLLHPAGAAVRQLAARAGFRTAVTVLSGRRCAASARAHQIDLKLLLITARADDPSFEAWTRALQREQIPFDAIVATADREPIHGSALSDGLRAKYQCVVLTTSSAAMALTTEERSALESFESTFGIRRINGYVRPSYEYGFSNAKYEGRMTGVVGSLTSEGKSLFPYLKGPVPFSPEAYGYLAAPRPGGRGAFEVLVSGRDGVALVGICRRSNGRQELVMTADSNSGTIHSELLFHGMLSWATRGVFLGTQRHYLTVHIDDVFASNSRRHFGLQSSEPALGAIRMQAEDAARALAWMQANNIRMELLYNGNGASPTDELTQALLAAREAFGWINHTWSHGNLDQASVLRIVSEIQQNIEWAEEHELPIDRSELVTGEHSGLANPNMVQALLELGVTWIGADNSSRPRQFSVGPALTVPRWPTNAYFNVGRRGEQLDEYNTIYMGRSPNIETTTSRMPPSTWNAYIESESSMIFKHLISNDPRPHFFHQSNLAEDGIFYDVIDPAIRFYRELIDAPLVRLGLADIGALLLKQERWADAVAHGDVTAYLCEATVYVQASGAMEVPLTGTIAGSEYGGQNSGWIEVDAKSLTTIDLAEPLDPRSIDPPKISGHATAGHCLSVSPGTWQASRRVVCAYQWQRCDASGVCTNIEGADEPKYVLGSSDVGAQVRVIVTGSDRTAAGVGVSALSRVVQSNLLDRVRRGSWARRPRH